MDSPMKTYIDMTQPLTLFEDPAIPKPTLTKILSNPIIACRETLVTSSDFLFTIQQTMKLPAAPHKNAAIYATLRQAAGHYQVESCKT